MPRKNKVAIEESNERIAHRLNLIQHLQERALLIESFGFPQIEHGEEIGQGQENIIYTVPALPRHVFRIEKIKDIDEERAHVRASTVDFLRSLPPNSFLSIPQLVSFRKDGGIDQLDDKAVGCLREYLVALDKYAPVVQDKQEIPGKIAEAKQRFIDPPACDANMIIFVLSQVMLGLEVLWKHNLAHRDIKSENILLYPAIRYSDDCIIPYQVKLTDFDNMFFYEDLVGTPITLSPWLCTKYLEYKNLLSEVQLLPVRKPQDVFADDIWALGVVLMEMIAKPKSEYLCVLLTNEICQYGYLNDKAQNDRWSKKISKLISDDYEEFKPLVLAMLTFDDRKRITLMQLMAHPLFSDKISQLKRIIAIEQDVTNTPYWPLAEEIRHLNSNFLAIQEKQLVLDNESRSGMTNRVRNIICLIGEIPRSNIEIKGYLLDLIDALNDPLTQTYFDKEIYGYLELAHAEIIQGLGWGKMLTPYLVKQVEKLLVDISLHDTFLNFIQTLISKIFEWNIATANSSTLALHALHAIRLTFFGFLQDQTKLSHVQAFYKMLIDYDKDLNGNQAENSSIFELPEIEFFIKSQPIYLLYLGLFQENITLMKTSIVEASKKIKSSDDYLQNVGPSRNRFP